MIVLSHQAEVNMCKVTASSLCNNIPVWQGYTRIICSLTSFSEDRFIVFMLIDVSNVLWIHGDKMFILDMEVDVRSSPRSSGQSFYNPGES